MKQREKLQSSECLMDFSDWRYGLFIHYGLYSLLGRGDWSFHGPFTVRENNLYWIIRRWPGGDLTFGGLQAKVRRVFLLGLSGRPVAFQQDGTRVTLRGLPDSPPDSLCPVFRIECDQPPSLYQCGGLRIPSVTHPHYNPCPSDIKH